jgi:lipopolysaccharide export system protein LptA
MNLFAKTAIKSLFLLGIVISLFGASFAEDVKITSDQFLVNESDSSAVFEGNVVVTQPNFTLWANKVIVTYGEEGPSDLKSFVALGNVKIKQPDQIATSNRGVYDPKTEILTLYDNVKVINDSGTITGQELIVNIATGVSKFPSQSGGGRVTAIFSQ